MINIFLIPSLLLVWFGYKQYCWVKHYTNAKKYYFLHNENLAFIFEVRAKYHSFKMTAMAVFLVLYLFVFESLSSAKTSQFDLMSCLLIVFFVILSSICFTMQARYEKKFNLLLAKIQDFRKHSIISNSQKYQIMSALDHANKSFMAFSVIYSILNLTLIFLV